VRALVIGGAACVFNDLAAAQSLGAYSITVAVNDIGDFLPSAPTARVSLHPDKFPGAISPIDDFPELWTAGTSTGSSSLFAVRYAIEKLKADKVVLCGVPMDRQPHFYGGEPWHGADAMWPAWEAALPFMAGRVRSMSGRTRELLGAPTPSWLAG
jgi:hypothetical protein